MVFKRVVAANNQLRMRPNGVQKVTANNQLRMRPNGVQKGGGC